MAPLANSLKHFFNAKVAKKPFAGSSDTQIDAQLHELCQPRLSQSQGVTGRISQDRVERISTTLRFLDKRDPSVLSRDWYKRPRLYAILRTIGALQLMDYFIEEGVTDFFLPFSHQTLPPFVHDCGQGPAFLEIQDYYLSDMKDIETESLHHKFIEDGNMCFRTEKKLGQGGFGAVDLVFSALSFRMYARKRVPRGRPSEKSLHAQKAMVQELKHLKKLDHRHLVKIVGSYTDKNYIAYLMVPIAKCTLDHFLGTTKVLTDAQRAGLREWYGCLAGAVQYLHSHKIRHRDLTCRNVLITDDNEIRISDFGTAYSWSDRLSSNTRHLSTQVSRDYMAPEVARRDERGSASDMWSLGVIYLRMTTRLLGHRLSELQSRIDKAAKELDVQPYVFANMHVVTKWLASLSDNNSHDAHDNEPIIWVRALLQEAPANRQDARFLMQDILESPSFEKFCCFNCREDFHQGSFAYDDGDLEEQTQRESYEATMEHMATLFQDDAAPKISENKTASIHQWMSGSPSPGLELIHGPKDDSHGPVDMLAPEWKSSITAAELQSYQYEHGYEPFSTPQDFDRWRTTSIPDEEDYDYDDGFYSANSDLDSSTEGREDAQSNTSHNTPDKDTNRYPDFRDSGLGFHEYESGSSLADEDDGRLFDEISDRPDSESEDDDEDDHPQPGRFRSALDVINESIEDEPDQARDESKPSEGIVPIFTEICDESGSEEDTTSLMSTPPDSAASPCQIAEAISIKVSQIEDVMTVLRPLYETRDGSSGVLETGAAQEPAGLEPQPEPEVEPTNKEMQKSDSILEDGDHDNGKIIHQKGEIQEKAFEPSRDTRFIILPTKSQQGNSSPNDKPKKKIRIAKPTNENEESVRVTPAQDPSIDDSMKGSWSQRDGTGPPVPLSSANIRTLNEAHGKRPPPIDPKGYLKKAWDSASSAPTSVVSAATKERLAGWLSHIVFHGNPGNVVYTACREGEPGKLRALLEHGCNPGTKAKPRPKPMLAAAGGATERHRKCVRQLIKFGGNVNVRARKTRQTPLHVAVLNSEFPGYAKLVRLLIEAGADVNARDANKDRPLALLFQKGVEKKPMPLTMYRRQALAILLQSDAEVNFSLLGTGETPLHLAVRRQDPYAVAMLIFKGADVRMKNAAGASLLQLTANQFRGGELAPDHAQVLEWLVRQGKDIIDEPAGASGRTALHLAVMAGTPGAVAILLEFGASITAYDLSGRTAIQLGQEEVDKVKNGEDISRVQDRKDILAMLTAP